MCQHLQGAANEPGTSGLLLLKIVELFLCDMNAAPNEGGASSAA